MQVDSNGTPGTVNGFVYDGYSLPRDMFTITNGLDLFSRKLRITVLADYKGGYNLFNGSGQFYAQNFPTWYSENLKSTSSGRPGPHGGQLERREPEHQHRLHRERRSTGSCAKSRRRSRFRPPLPARSRARDVQLVFSARNLHTWTKYTGTDPESGYINGTGDVQDDFSTTAPRTYFLLRANLHY